MNRRAFLVSVAAASAFSARGDVRRSRMGIAVTSYLSYARPKDTLEFLEHAHALGAAGIQMPLASRDAAYIHKLRARCEELGMYYEMIAALPDANDSAAFEATVAAAKEAGALAIRVNCLPGRRYENFTNLADWRKAVAGAQERIDIALKIAEKQQVPLAIENHKDFTADEMVALMKARSSRWLGVCLDTGNNISLLDDPMALVEALAPYAVCSHIKDMGVAPDPDGFLLSELPLGEGMLDMRQVIATVRRARPDTRLTLEMITRDPLRVPCLTDRYWATFPDRSGVYLARTMRLVRERSLTLPVLSGLSRQAQLDAEELNVRKSMDYARDVLNL